MNYLYAFIIRFLLSTMFKTFKLSSVTTTMIVPSLWLAEHFSLFLVNEATIAKIILIKPIKFYDLISIIFKRKRGFFSDSLVLHFHSLAQFQHEQFCWKKLNLNAFVCVCSPGSTHNIERKSIKIN